MKQLSQSELVYLLKHGGGMEIEAYFHSTEKKCVQENFVQFMDKAIKSSGYTRAQIAQRAGLSRDYMYKVLRGDKRTTERDYIIAICISMNMDLEDTQTALRLYPFPTIGYEDARDVIIRTAIISQESIDELNNWLEKAGCVLLRTSPDMEKAKVGPAGSTFPTQEEVSFVTSKDNKKKRRCNDMEITNTIITAEHAGNAPFDFFYGGELELTDEKGGKLYAQACFWPTGESQYGINKVSMYEDKFLDESEYLEVFEELEEAINSDFNKYYLELEKLTDKKVAETLQQVDDTKYYGIRIGAKHSEGSVMYLEAFNSEHPEDKEYYQVIWTDGSYQYSASHESNFMKIELEDIYPIYFGKENEQEYFFKGNDLNNLGKYESLRQHFEVLQGVLDANNMFVQNHGEEKKMKEIRRRSMYNLEDGFNCSPFGIAAIDAEIALEDDAGEMVYLYGCWIDEGGDEITTRAYKESLYDLHELINKGEGNVDQIIAEIERIEGECIKDDERFEPYYKELEAMVLEKAKKEGIEYFFEDEEDEDDDDWDEDDNEQPDWDSYPGNCRFALETVNNTVLEFTEEFRREIFAKAKEKLEEGADLSLGYEELCELIDVTDTKGQLVFNKKEYIDGFDGDEILTLLHKLGYEPVFEGMSSQLGHFGVEVIR